MHCHGTDSAQSFTIVRREPRQRVLDALLTWDQPRLQELLERRPDLAAAPDLAAVAHKAVQWVSLREAVERLPALPATARIRITTPR